MAVVRLLLAVTIGIVLVGLAAPVVDHGREATAKTAAQTELERIQATIRALTERSDPTASAWSARRQLTVSIREEDVGSVGVDWIAIGGVPGRSGPTEPPGTDLLAYSIDGTVTVRRLSSVDIRVEDIARNQDARPLVIRADTTLEFDYRLGRQGPVVVVRVMVYNGEGEEGRT